MVEARRRYEGRTSNTSGSAASRVPTAARWEKATGRGDPIRLDKTYTLVPRGIGLVIGYYDGFFGPGTGSFFVFVLVRVLGYDFLNASACTKLLNATSNASALALFAWQGHVWWHLTWMLALANVVGSVLGTRMALKHGTGFVRIMFLVVVSALVLKTGHDAFVR